ncbi:hypothetical protein R4M03_08085 [Brachyspira pilosicoli]|uniref:Lipoprotein n=2 Tax=Brachyspira pilosicoli TaxID=52584 RepID=A0A3B6VNV9_BRAPL|nr:hypothetical protein [Brachyspira pilosicoli]AGA67513.1 hypothetical protein BPP43_11845 [Brachyspira pilosicoli P43/6/78]WIH81315.1 hypothetical protein NEI04_10960 [Brachyspira pilosicoli]WIH85752.1 hypothetical protein NEI03_11225 [Brachyspira pilosicoli]WIH88012.1 hypothetical protein NEI05_11040 [Brachyspira pilosicoli]WIH90291.1 hypothetical protein NEI02_11375 [Brachyspira pilosicoli]
MRYILVIMFLVCANLFSQYATNDAYTPPQNNNNNNTAATEEESYITNDAVVGRKPAVINIPITGFKNIKLGSTREDTIKAILEDNTMMLPKEYMLNTDGVDLASEESATFLSLEENKFYKSGYFIFKDDSLYSITIYFQPNQVDFLELLSSLSAKYGKGAFLDAETVSWQNGDNRIILERPSIIKYINMNNITTTSQTRIREKESIPPQNNRKEILEGL